MGRNLFIRVSAATYNEDAVRKDWPRLCATVHPGDGPFPVVASAQAPFGVMQLLRELVDNGAFLENPVKDALVPFLPRLADLLKMMEDALGERDVPQAHALTNEIEDTLDEAEKAQPKP